MNTLILEDGSWPTVKQQINPNSSGVCTAGILVVFRKDKTSAAYHRLFPTHPLKLYSSATFLPQ